MSQPNPDGRPYTTAERDELARRPLRRVAMRIPGLTGDPLVHVLDSEVERCEALGWVRASSVTVLGWSQPAGERENEVLRLTRSNARALEPGEPR